MDWKTWSPFQSEDTQRICRHMTAEEKEIAEKRGGMYGIWVALTFAIPVGMAVGFRETTAVVIAAAILAAIHIGFIPFWLRSQRQFLCNTQWAREQGMSAEELRLFGWGRNGDTAG